jgi:predicted nucleic acid-binding protein
MIGLDCNILVQLAFADHPANAKTLAAVEAETGRGEKLVFPSLVVNEFLHVATDPRRFAPPLTMTEAMDWIEDFLANPMVGLIEPTKAGVDQALRWMRQFSRV